MIAQTWRVEGQALNLENKILKWESLYNHAIIKLKQRVSPDYGQIFGGWSCMEICYGRIKERW
jgi:hypothetical protein